MRHEEKHECEQFVRRITRNFLALARTRQQTIICVSNEVGLGVVPDTSLAGVPRLARRVTRILLWQPMKSISLLPVCLCN